MGAFLYLFILLLLVISSIVLLIDFAISRKKASLRILAMQWLVVIALFTVGSIIGHMQTPIKLTKKEIVGEYRIDTTLYPGTNARWQYKHYKFSITEDDNIVFVNMHDNNTITTYKHTITYRPGPPDLWTVRAASTHHVVAHTPTLYRSHSRFYYVFSSEKYGNMFFRKSEK